MERASGGRRREEALVNGLRRWRLRGSVGAEARQCPLKLCQSGLDDAERDRAATVEHRRHHTTLIGQTRTHSNHHSLDWMHL